MGERGGGGGVRGRRPVEGSRMMKKNKKIKEERGRGDASWQAGASRLQQHPPETQV